MLVAGVASNIKSSFNKEGRLMGSFWLDDGTKTISVNCFGDDWKIFRNYVKTDELVYVKGQVREDKFSPSGI